MTSPRLLQYPARIDSGGATLRISPDHFEDKPGSGKRLLHGALIGIATGLVACTLISNTIEDEGGFQTCTGGGYLSFSIGGAVLGGLVAHFTE